MVDASGVEKNLPVGERINQLVDEHFVKLKDPGSGLDYFLNGGQDKQFSEIAKTVGIKKERIYNISNAIGVVCATHATKDRALQSVEEALEGAYQKRQYTDEVFKNLRTMSLRFIDRMWALAQDSANEPHSTATVFRTKKGDFGVF